MTIPLARLVILIKATSQWLQFLLHVHSSCWSLLNLAGIIREAWIVAGLLKILQGVHDLLHASFIH